MKAIQNLFQRIVVNTLSVAVLIGIAIPSALADDDLPKSKDHPLLTRFPDSRITEYQKTFNAVEFKVSSAKDGKLGAGAKTEKKMIEGDATFMRAAAGEVDLDQPIAVDPQLSKCYQVHWW